MTTDSPTSLSVLIVEDRLDVAQSTADLLAVCGHTARVARWGAAALAEAAADPPDVVLLDLGLPDMDGWAVARALRARVGRQPVVVAVTGRGEDADLRASADAGVDMHLVKPVEPAALLGLLARVREALSAHRTAPAAGGGATPSIGG